MASGWRSKHARRSLAAFAAGAILCLTAPALAAGQAPPRPAQNPAPAGSAQESTVRVIRDRSTIWRSDFRVAAAIARNGVVLTVVGRRGDWLEVVLPLEMGGNGSDFGFIYRSNVELASGSLPSAPAPRRQTPPASSASSSSAGRRVGVWGFGHFGYTRFAARESFQAVLGQAGGGVFGGGGEVRIGSGFFVGGAVEHFSKTGERVYVLDQEVFHLGIPDQISITPISVTAGWRFQNERATPYFGGGAGTVLYKETSSLAEAGQNIDQRFRSYHVLGGVDVRSGWLATAFEVEYSRVPDALGVAGASAAFAEHDLGGWATRIKIMVGR
jgi:hypothetical protein